MRLNKSSLLLLFPSVILLGSCMKDVKFKNLEPNFAIPLVNSSLDVYDVLARQDSNELVVIDENSGKLALFYQSDPIGFSINDLISIPNLNESINVAVGSTITPAPGTTHSFGDNFKANFSITNTEELYGIDFSAGALSLNLNSSINSPVNYTVTFKSITKGGSPISFSGTLNNGQNASHTESLANAIGNFVDNLSNPNTFEFSANFTIQGNGNTIQASNGIQVTLGITNPAYSEIRAYYGQTNQTLLQDSILLRIFRNTDGASFAGSKFQFSNPYIRLKFENTINIPLAFNFNTLDAYQVATGTNTPILASVPNPYPLPQPTGNTAGIDSLIIDKNNSNVASVITPDEQFVIVDFGASTNPAGKTVNTIHPTDELKADAKVVLPLEGYTSGWRITKDININIGQELEDVQEAAFRFNIENKFPLDVKLKFLLLDNNDLVIDTLAPKNNYLPAGGQPNAQGRVITPTKIVEDLVLDANLLSNLKRSSKMRVQAELQTTDADQNKIVAIFDDYFINIKIGLKIAYELKLSGDDN